MNDVKEKYKAGGKWKKRIFDKMGKHRHESTKPGGFFIAIPPEGGWPGGLPENNGYKKRGR